MLKIKNPSSLKSCNHKSMPGKDKQKSDQGKNKIVKLESKKENKKYSQSPTIKDPNIQSWKILCIKMLKISINSGEICCKNCQLLLLFLIFEKRQRNIRKK